MLLQTFYKIDPVDWLLPNNGDVAAAQKKH
jgi:hypothetical protein